MRTRILRGVSGDGRGFTVLEVLIAMIIFCIAVFSSIAILKGSLVRFGKQTGAKKVFSEVAQVLDYMERYLVSAVCDTDAGIAFKGAKGYVRFVSPFSEGVESDLAKFGIYFDEESNAVKVAVVRIDSKSPDFVFPAGFAGAQVLGENIISYYDGADWLDGWDTRGMEEPKLPRLIKVEITAFSEKIEGERHEEGFEKFIRIIAE